MSRITYKLRKQGSIVILSAYKTTQDGVGLMTNLISFQRNGIVSRHNSVNPDFGFDLDNLGRLNIHG